MGPCTSLPTTTALVLSAVQTTTPPSSSNTISERFREHLYQNSFELEKEHVATPNALISRLWIRRGTIATSSTPSHRYKRRLTSLSSPPRSLPVLPASPTLQPLPTWTGTTHAKVHG